MAILMVTPRENIVVCEGVDWADISLRERQSGEAVHLRQNTGRKDRDDDEIQDAQYQPCKVCGKRRIAMQDGVGYINDVWVMSESSHEVHLDACSP